MAGTKLSKSMSLTQFKNGYWYATELKIFGEALGIPSAKKLRKDELGKAITQFLKAGKIQAPTKRNLSRAGVKDVDLGLSLQLPIVNYTSNKATKTFIEQEARKLVPHLKRKSGARYRLNRWREEQLTRGISITYEDLVKRYIKVNQTEGRFDQSPSCGYINFLSDFLSVEKNATRAQALEAWRELK